MSLMLVCKLCNQYVFHVCHVLFPTLLVSFINVDQQSCLIVRRSCNSLWLSEISNAASDQVTSHRCSVAYDRELYIHSIDCLPEVRLNPRLDTLCSVNSHISPSLIDEVGFFRTTELSSYVNMDVL